jgi:outer membrane receptor for ferrienterochelin and colicins
MTYTNVSQARVQGYEVHGRFAVSDALALRANYTFSDAEDRDTERPLSNTPEHLANLGIDWQLLPSLGMTLDYQYTGSQGLYVPARGGNRETGAYHTLNLGAKFKASDELAFTAGLNNLTNTKRDEVAQSIDHILMGRSAFVGVSYDL